MKKSFMALVKSRAMIYIIAAVVIVGAIGGVILVKQLGSDPANKGEQQENPKKEDEDDIGLKPAEDGEDDDEYIEFDDDSTGSDKGNAGSDTDDKTPDSNDNDDSGNTDDGNEEPLNDGSDGRLF